MGQAASSTKILLKAPMMNLLSPHHDLKELFQGGRIAPIGFKELTSAELLLDNRACCID